jgi:hypothetical protein
MRKAIVLFLFATAPVWAAEPLIGTWKMSSQVVDGQKTDPDPVTLRVLDSGGGALEFDYSVPVNNVNFVGTKFTSVRLDGSSGDIRNSHGDKIGVVKITKVGPSQYKAIIEGPSRPTANGTITISPDGKTLTSDSATTKAGQAGVHAVQVFARF